MPYTSNIATVTAKMEVEIPRAIATRMAKMVKKIIMAIDVGVHEKTPVWSGLAIRNMIWTRDAPNMQQFNAIEVGDVHGEGRRDANASAARQTRDTLLRTISNNPYGVFYLSNASHHIFDLEAGQLPSPDRSRVPPGGMFGLTYAEVRSGIGG
jgi:hypothetical protein